MNSESTVEQRLALARLLDDVANSRLSAAQVIDELQSSSWKQAPWKETAFETAWHSLSHYQSDADIHEKDAVYRKRQEEQLRFLASFLRSKDYHPRARVPGSGYRVRWSLIEILAVVGLVFSLISLALWLGSR